MRGKLVGEKKRVLAGGGHPLDYPVTSYLLRGLQSVLISATVYRALVGKEVMIGKRNFSPRRLAPATVYADFYNQFHIRSLPICLMGVSPHPKF